MLLLIMLYQMHLPYFKKFTKNDELLHQVIKLGSQNNCYKLNKLLTFLENIEDRYNFKHFLKTDFALTVDDCLSL